MPLGTRLLQRTTRKLRLSESGHEVYARCVDMVSAAQAVMAVSGQFDAEPQGLVRVSVPKAVGRFVIHPHIPEFLVCSGCDPSHGTTRPNTASSQALATMLAYRRRYRAITVTTTCKMKDGP